MPAYLVGTIRVTDAALWQRYVDQVGATFPPHGGRIVFRGTQPVALAGAAHGELIVVAEFPDMAALRGWHNSPAYQALVALREAGADVVLTGYDG